mmetsp:Transcript_4011/g.11212  ORF Transcript_4011/g.11212 Transcript_4011/m.11212 type:complete len:279 (-) Transcript_4011:55-891(-)
MWQRLRKPRGRRHAIFESLTFAISEVAQCTGERRAMKCVHLSLPLAVRVVLGVREWAECAAEGVLLPVRIAIHYASALAIAGGRHRLLVRSELSLHWARCRREHPLQIHTSSLERVTARLDVSLAEGAKSVPICRLLLCNILLALTVPVQEGVFKLQVPPLNELIHCWSCLSRPRSLVSLRPVFTKLGLVLHFSLLISFLSILAFWSIPTIFSVLSIVLFTTVTFESNEERLLPTRCAMKESCWAGVPIVGRARSGGVGHGMRLGLVQHLEGRSRSGG